MLFKKDFKILNRKYYLANTRYYNINYLLLSFYYSIYYHLKKQVVVSNKMVNKK